MKKSLRFAVIGAGNGGMAMAAHIAMKGYYVNLYNRTFDKIKMIKETGGIYLIGLEEGFGKLNLVTDDIRQAIEDVDIIMVTLPANAHKEIAEKMAPYLSEKQIVILNPGRTFGALEFLNVCKKYGLRDIIIAETQTFIYACRIIDPVTVKIFGIKENVPLATIPANFSSFVVSMISDIYPGMRAVSSVLDTSLNNIGAVFHPAPVILNCSRIELKQEFEYYIEGITPAIAKILEDIDRERIKVARRLGINVISAKEWLEESYGSQGTNLYEAIQNTGCYYGIKAPPVINTRYIFEDVPTGLVPIFDLGRFIGIKTPLIESLINFASSMYGVDFYSTGRNLKNLGLEGLNVDEITQIVLYGNVIKEEEVAI